MNRLVQPPRPRALCLSFALLAAVLLLVLAFQGPKTHGDDVMYANALEARSLFDYLTERYAIWSGRTVIDAMTLLLINHVYLWRGMMLASLLLMLGLIAHISESDRRLLGLIFVFQAFFILPRDVLHEAVWWMTASFNYLWPFTAGLLVFLVFIRPDLPWWVLALCVPAAVYAASHEQAGLLLVGFQSLASIALVRTKRFRWIHGLLIGLTLLVYASVLAAPGSLKRYEAVTGYWFPEYAEWSLDERIFSGFDLAFSHFFNSKNFLSMIFCALLAVLVFQRTPNRTKRCLALVPLVVFFLQIPPRIFRNTSNGWAQLLADVWSFQVMPGGFVSQGIADYATAVNPLFLLHFSLVATGVLAVGVSLLNAGVRGRFLGRHTTVVVFVAALLSAAVIGMSPTLYVSGTRVFFFQDILILLLAALVFMQIEGETVKRIVNCLLALMVADALWRMFKNV